MPRVLGLGLLFAASAAAAAEAPIASSFALREAFAVPAAERQILLKFEAPRVDYSQPARPERKRGFLAAVQVAPNSFFGVGLSDRKPRRSVIAPDPGRDAKRGGKKFALRFSMDF